ncbi:MAG: hypothetical protein NVSMB52_10490 [Chloroflexota bacterium]
MNIYEQLQGMKVDLERQDAMPRTLRIIEDMIARAEPQKDSALSFSRLQVVRRVMQMPEVLNNEDVRLDLIALEGDLEEAAATRQDSGPAFVDDDRKPKLKKFYKKK